MQNSTSTNGRRLAAAMFLGMTSAAMVAGTAHADGGVTGATVDPQDRDEGAVAMVAGTHHHVDTTALIGLKAGSTAELWTYCIQNTVELQEKETYDEKDWSSESSRIGIDTQHLEGIKWILNNSYPAVGNLGQLSTSAGVSGTLTAKEAVEGTQAAIWSFSDASSHTQLDAANEKDANVIALYNWLTAQAKGHMGDSDQPQASLSLGADQTAKPGDKVAFKLTSTDTTDAFSVVLSGANAKDAQLVDAGGKAIPASTKFKNGDTVYIQLPTSGSGSLTVTASGTVSGIQAGRVFVSHDGKKSQNLILAQAENAPVSATAKVVWTAPVVTPPSTPSSTPSSPASSHPSTPSAPSTTPTTPPSTTPTTPGTSLAHTGAGNTMGIAGGALALVAAGGGMVVYTRRKKQGSHS